MNDKLKKYLEKFALAWSPFGTSGWDSSAKNLENDLKKIGVKSPVKLYYQYALPENMKHSEFMTKIAVLDLCATFKLFSRVQAEIFFDKSLSLVEKLRVVRYLKSERENARKKIDEYVKFVQFANPELSRLKIQNEFDKFDILSGALFGFGPGEIEYFINRKERHANIDSGQEDGIHRRIEKFGIRLSYVLSPKTAEAIISVLEKNKKNGMIRSNRVREI